MIEVSWPLCVAISLVRIATLAQHMAVVLSCSIAQGAAAGLATVSGVCSGPVVRTLVAALGLGAPVRASKSPDIALQVVGATHLADLGLQWLRTPQGPLAIPGTSPKRLARKFFDGALSKLCSPKTVLFYLAFLPQFVVPGTRHVGLSLLVIGRVFAFLGWMVEAPPGFVAAAHIHWLRLHPQSLAWLFRVSSAVLLGLGLCLQLPLQWSL